MQTPLCVEEPLEEGVEGKSWSFLEVSKNYILGDVKALYQILIKFFNTVISKFPRLISAISMPAFHALITPYFHPSMLYKLA